MTKHKSVMTNKEGYSMEALVKLPPRKEIRKHMNAGSFVWCYAIFGALQWQGMKI